MAAQARMTRCELRMPEELWAPFRAELLAVSVERMGYLLARGSVFGPSSPGGPTTYDLLVRHAVVVPDAAYVQQTGVRVEIVPAFCREILRTCYETGLSLIDVHTHPFSQDRVQFSGHDVANMRSTHADLLDGIPPDPVVIAASLVLGQRSIAGSWTEPTSRELAPLNRICVLGDHLVTLSG